MTSLLCPAPRCRLRLKRTSSFPLNPLREQREQLTLSCSPPLFRSALSSSIVMSETSPTTESVRMTSSSPSAAAPIGLRPSPSTLRASLPSTVTLPPISATTSAPEVFSSNLSRSPERPSTRSTPGSLQQPKLLADQSTPPASLTPAPDAARQPTPNPFLAPARPTQPLPSTGFESTPALSVGYGSPVSPRDPQTPASVGLGLRGGWYGAAGAKAYDGFGGRSERFEYSDQDVVRSHPLPPCSPTVDLVSSSRLTIRRCSSLPFLLTALRPERNLRWRPSEGER
jgi:hypothetical protein